MSRANVFVTAGNDNRSVAIGGRQGSSGGWAKLNTDNGSKSNCAVSVSVDVDGERHHNGKSRKTCHSCGHKWIGGHYDTPDRRWTADANWVSEEDDLTRCPKCNAFRQGVDTRKSRFQVTLPEQTDDCCEVCITTPSERAANIVRVGAMLVGIKTAMQCAEGMVQDKPELIKHGLVQLDAARRLLAETEADANKNIPNVILPGGVTLAHALACVRLVAEITAGQASEN